ncbi:MAG: DUF3619 family protein [Burkholderiaceae bacterium]|nr:DUF3619 family protein [Burkholderiaceae bacterium]
MNERELARIVRVALDESADRLPYRTTHRLEAARAAALAHARVEAAPRPAHEIVRVGYRPTAELAGGPAPRLGWRIAAIVVPIALVAAGLFGISVLETHQRADDLAELDAAMLADEVPISAYADRGFGVYLRNVSSQARGHEEP